MCIGKEVCGGRRRACDENMNILFFWRAVTSVV